MGNKEIRESAATTVLAGAAGVAGSYAVAGATQSFVAPSAESLVVGALPGALVATNATIAD